MMRSDFVLAEAFTEMMSSPFSEAACVNKDERGPVCFDKSGEAAIYLGPDLVRHHRFERRARKLDRQIEIALIASVDNHTTGGLCRREACG